MTELIKQCLSLSRVDREKLTKILQESLLVPEVSENDRFQQLYEIASGLFGYGILTNRRDYNLVLGRRFIAKQMSEEGYSRQATSRCLVKSHASVLHMIKQMDIIFEHPDYYALEIAQWNQFQNKLKEYDK